MTATHAWLLIIGLVWGYLAGFIVASLVVC